MTKIKIDFLCFSITWMRAALKFTFDVENATFYDVHTSRRSMESNSAAKIKETKGHQVTSIRLVSFMRKLTQCLTHTLVFIS